jgi:hypothetical protein
VCAGSFFFDAVGQEIELVATSALKWRCVRKNRVGSKTLVIGTTVTTGICNMSRLILCDVTGTVASTGDKAVPNGSAIGERIAVRCSAQASTPHGDIGIAGLSAVGAAITAMDDFEVVGEGAEWEWTGAAWQLTGALLGVTLT